MKIISIVGTRPNFMKIASILNAFKEYNVDSRLVHTGQHYDKNMSESFFQELDLPKPDKLLNVGSGLHGEQTAKIMIEFEKYCLDVQPDMVIVPGDVNSTLACSLVASKLGIKISHVEAGLRSFDRSMPEEINRLITDQISDLLFVTEKSGIKNLKNEGVSKDKIYFVGNCMIDTLGKYKKHFDSKSLVKYNFKLKDYVMITMHRPSNVDNIVKLKSFCKIFNEISKKINVLFPMHPRTKKLIIKHKIQLSSNIVISDPLPYLEFLDLINSSKMVITDSGGIQEETTYLQVQCLTIRENTERPITSEIGTNHLVGTNKNNIIKTFESIMQGEIKNGIIPDLWDGKSGQRIARTIYNDLKND